MGKRLFVSSVLVLAVASPGWAQTPAQTEASLPAYDLQIVEGQDTSDLWIGDQFVVRVGDLKVESAAGHKLEVPAGSGNLEDLGWEVEAPENPLPDEKELFFRLSPLASGKLVLPSLLIQDAAGKAIGRTNPFALNVKSPLSEEDAKSLADVPPRPPVSLPFPLWAAILLAVLAVAALVAAGIAIRNWIRSRKKPVVEGPRIPKPEDEEALFALDALKKKGFVRLQQFKPHYFTASELLKRYIGRRYDFDASESTAREIIVRLEDQHLNDQVVDRFEKLFEHLDQVKFSDAIPTPAEADGICDEIRDLVNQTKRPRVVPLLTPEGLPKGSALGVFLSFGLLSLTTSLTAEAAPLGTDVPVGSYLENRKGLEAFESGKIEDARQHFGSAQAQNPDRPELEFNQGTVQMESGDLENAVTALKGAATDARKKGDTGLSARSYYNLGIAQSKATNYKGAIQAYLQAIKNARQAKDKDLEMDARKNLERLMKKKEQEKQDKKDKEEKGGKQDQAQNQKQAEGQQDPKNSQGGQQAKQGEQDQNKDGQDNKDNKDKEKQVKQFQDPSQTRSRQFKSLKLSKEDAERVLGDLSGREKDLQGRLNKNRGAPQTNSKDW